MFSSRLPLLARNCPDALQRQGRYRRRREPRTSRASKWPARLRAWAGRRAVARGRQKRARSCPAEDTRSTAPRLRRSRCESREPWIRFTPARFRNDVHRAAGQMPERRLGDGGRVNQIHAARDGQTLRRGCGAWYSAYPPPDTSAHTWSPTRHCVTAAPRSSIVPATSSPECQTPPAAADTGPAAATRQDDSRPRRQP